MSDEFETKMQAIAKLFSAFPAVKMDGEELRAALYYEVVEDAPAWAVRTVVDAFVKGKITDHDGRFIPSCAQFARACDQLVEGTKPSPSVERVMSLLKRHHEGYDYAQLPQSKEPGMKKLKDVLPEFTKRQLPKPE